MSTTKSDILIVGGGIFGVSAAYHLVQKYADTKNITLLDRGAAPSDQAASTDINKIIRADYTSPFYMSLAHEAIDAWSSWPMLRDLYHRTGWIMMDEKGSDVAARIRANFRAGGRPDVSRDRTERDIKEEYRGLFARTEFGEYGSYYANPSAGWAEAGEAVRVMTEEAVRLGVRYEVGEVDGAVLYDDDDAAEARVRGVKTKDGRLFTAEKVLLATGAWTSALMSSVEEALALPEGHRVESQVSAAGVCVAHFRLSDEESRIYRQLPVLIFGAKGEVLPPTSDNIFKFTNAHTFKNTLTATSSGSGHIVSAPPLDPDQCIIPAGLVTESLDLIRQRFPQILDNGRLPDYYRLCWDSITPDQNQLITKHPRIGGLYLAVGGSFHSYKFLPTIGRYVVTVLEDASNGEEKDRAWGWKDWTTISAGRGAHEKVVPKRELSDLA